MFGLNILVLFFNLHIYWKDKKVNKLKFVYVMIYLHNIDKGGTIIIICNISEDSGYRFYYLCRIGSQSCRALSFAPADRQTCVFVPKKYGV